MGELKAKQIPEKLRQLTNAEGLTLNEAAALQLLWKTVYGGNNQAIKEIMGRTEGKSNSAYTVLRT
jgi:hypothetical protein